MELAPHCQNHLQGCQLECRPCQASEEQLFYLSPCCAPSEPAAETGGGEGLDLPTPKVFLFCFVLFLFSLAINIFLLISETPKFSISKGIKKLR